MNPKPPSRPQPSQNNGGQSDRKQSDRKQPAPSGNISRDIAAEINQLDHLSEYGIRQLVNRASEFGPYLKQQRLETNQIRKFLDAINRVKAQLIEKNIDELTKALPSDIEDEIVLLKPKLAYAAARQKAAIPLSDVMSVAIDKTKNYKDFNRLVQFIESIIAYHKAEGGK
jgi:CRISPR-associated protein Csm2